LEEGTFGPLLHAKFHPHRCNVSPLRGEKPQNWPLSKLNTGRFALRAMLPVISTAAARIKLIFATFVCSGEKSSGSLLRISAYRQKCTDKTHLFQSAFNNTSNE